LIMLGWTSKNENEVPEMRPSSSLSRRTFLLTGAAAGGGLLLGFALPSLFTRTNAAATESFEPDAFIRIGKAISEDSLVLGRGVVHDTRNRAERLYPNDPLKLRD